jgi:sugar lactone lactonase YvrE
VLCALGATAHYLKWALGNPWQPVGWLLSMVFLLLAFLPEPSELGANFKSVIKPKTAFFVFWILFFVLAHLWNFRTAPWNGDGIFDDAAQEFLLVKTHGVGRPFQAAWFQSYTLIAHETLFQYYLWPWLHLFGYNILTNEAASLALWCTTFLFTLLLTDLFFESYVVTSAIALAFTFLPFAFIYSFFAFHYEMAAPLCVASLYFLHVGFKTDSFFCVALGGIAAGLCLASSLVGQQYVVALLVFVVLYAVFNRKRLKQGFNWRRVLTVIYGFAAAAIPILAYIVFNRHDYAYHNSPYLDRFWQAVRGHPSPDDITYYIRNLWTCFFGIPGPRLFFPDALPIPLPYYWLLLPGFALALWQKRFEIVLLATIPVVGVFVSGGPFVEHRLLVAIPFWIILIGFGLNSATQLRLPPNVKIFVWSLSALVLVLGLVPAIHYIYTKTKDPASISWFQQQDVAVARFLRHVVAGQEHPDPPRLEHDEFNRIQGIPDPPYETLICTSHANVVIHMFLHDYDNEKMLSFCDGHPMFVMTVQDIWSHNKKAIANYVPNGKDLKLIWESGPPAEKIIEILRPLRDLATEESLSFSFGGIVRTFYVLNIPYKNIRQFQERVNALPATPETPPPPLTALPVNPHDMFRGGKGTGKGEFDSPTGIAVDGNGNILVADTNNGRIEKFSPSGAFITSLGTKGSGHGQLGEPNGIAIDRVGNIYVAEVASNHRVQKLAPDGTFIAEWKGPDAGFYGPRRIAIGPDDSIYVVDQGRTRIAKFSPDGQVVATWGSGGSGDGQFRDHTSVAVDSTSGKVYVADPHNKRIQVFDSNGKFLTKWLIPEWGRPAGFEDLAVDSKTGRLYASSANMDTVLIFDLNGTRIGSLRPRPPDKLEGPSALALTGRKLYVLNMAGNRVSLIDL